MAKFPYLGELFLQHFLSVRLVISFRFLSQNSERVNSEEELDIATDFHGINWKT